jgi:protein-tyrosine phosphatase
MTTALSKLNFRDVGGYATSDGRRIKRGMLYRSEGPASFNSAHRSELAQLQVRSICDLRSPAERVAAPNDWTGTARLFNLGLTNDLRSKPGAGGELRDDPTESGVRAAMLLNYSQIPAALHPYWRDLTDSLIEGETPLLIHCTAGKDRTGVLVALLLELLGVPHDTVVADYQASSVFGTNLRLAGSVHESFEKAFGFVPSEAVIDAMIGVYPEFLDAAFRSVHQHWGSLALYFTSAGVDADRLERLRSALLETSVV